MKAQRRFWLDGDEFGAPHGAWGVELATVIEGAPARRSFRAQTPRRHGTQAIPGSKFEPGKVAMSCYVTSADPVDGSDGGIPQLEANRADLLRRIGVAHRFPVLGYAAGGDAPEREAVVEISGEVAAERIGDHGFAFKLAFTLDLLTFWRDVEPVTVHYGSASALRGGSAPITDALIMSPGKGQGTFIRVVDVPTGKWIRFEGDVPAGSWVRFDPTLETAWITGFGQWAGGTEVPGLVTVGAGGFELSPEVDFSAPADTWIRARKAFL